MTDKIAKFLDLEPIETEELKEIPETEIPSLVDDADTRMVKKNLADLVEVSKAATAEVYVIASSSQQSRDYDTLAKMIKTTADINKDYLSVDSHGLDKMQKMKNLQSPEDNGKKEVHQTIVFQGTTEEMLKQLEHIKK